MFLTWLMLAVALCLSTIAAFYSIIGLTAIFAAAVIPVAIMGTILEIAKLTVTVWLHEYWRQCKRTMKAYLVPAVGILMLITSMGIFGFLSKAHLDQAVPAGDITSQVQIYDEKIRTQRDNIEAARNALRQMDAQVDQVLGRTTDDKGAERAVQIRRQQAAERTRLQNDISRAQTEIQRLQEQRAPIAAQARRVEAEVGPIKYIAALIYGDNPDQGLLEKAVRWVIIILVIVFDPLAIFMLLAATESYKWERYGAQGTAPLGQSPQKPIQEYLNGWRQRLESWRNKNANVDAVTTPAKDLAVESTRDNVASESLAPVVARTDSNSKVKYQILDDADDESVPADDDEFDDNHVMKAAQQLWKLDNPGKTLKEQRHLYAQNKIDKLPWEDYLDDPRLKMETEIGDEFPGSPLRGQTFIKVDEVPTQLYKFNGDKWIEIDKTQSDTYAYNDAYTDYLIGKISSGEYDPELLTEIERSQIEQKLRRTI